MQWYYWVAILGFLAIMYILMIVKQRKQTKQAQQVMESFKPGDKVITHIGIYGKIKRIYNTTFGKVCVLEIGDKNKIEFELDMRYIAGLDEKTLVADERSEEKTTQDLEKEQLDRIEKPEEENNNKKTKN